MWGEWQRNFPIKKNSEAVIWKRCEVVAVGGILDSVEFRL